MSRRRHHKTQENEYPKKRLVFRRLYRKLAETVRTWRGTHGREFQIRAVATGNQTGSKTCGRQPCTADRQWWRRRWSWTGSSSIAALVSRVVSWWERSDVVKLGRWQHQMDSRIHHWLHGWNRMCWYDGMLATRCRCRSPDVIVPNTVPTIITMGERIVTPIDGWQSTAKQADSICVTCLHWEIRVDEAPGEPPLVCKPRSSGTTNFLGLMTWLLTTK